MGGTGLEPVTPSLSIASAGLRPVAQAPNCRTPLASKIEAVLVMPANLVSALLTAPAGATP
jgi:hypothetical protein